MCKDMKFFVLYIVFNIRLSYLWLSRQLILEINATF